MKIGLYIKDILYVTGGTESYTVRMAQALQRIYPEANIHFVTECYSKKSMPSHDDFVRTLDSKYGTQLRSKGIFLDAVYGSNKNKIFSLFLRKKIENHSKGFDLFFYCSRGHYIFKARKNIAIIHFPMEKLFTIKKNSNPISKFFARIKDKKYAESYKLFLPNSNFTKAHLQKLWPEIPENKIKLLYPPVLPIPQLNLQKKNQIFVCSRLERDKNLEALMDAYKSSDFLVNNYSLIIAGGSDEGSIYLPELIEHTRGYNISVLDNKPFSEIAKLYNESKVFWHCKGYGIDENTEPYKCEHFGITTVEAMSAGCVPIVINKAGQKEIVQNECGEKWLTLEELTEKTERLAKDEKLQAVYAENAKKRAKEYFLDSFTENLRNILNNL
ncbi:MAG: glycosyltransferase [Treponema sp.]|uniref:glycosyltransferase n=1 Tax=Treponema sp. TaxID=166 RepID=UPI0025E9272D|nr:glycosyltransferase [Treponema sp.]MBQ8679086.1 glycosyltransferase [Treponema sp.]